MLRALVRRPGPEIHAGLSRTPQPDVDPGVACAQHEAYCRALQEAGLELQVLAALPGHPDACFVEDCAVILAPHVLLTRPGAPSRRGEVASIAAALPDSLERQTMSAPASLDGGDVMRLGRRLFVGRSARSNEAGIACLRGFAARAGLTVDALPVPAALHLKSLATPVTDSSLLLLEDSLDPALFAPFEVISVPGCEALAANVLALGRTLLMPDRCPQTREKLEARGLRVLTVDTSELAKLDGALTCLSLLW